MDRDRDELVRAACMGDLKARNELAPWLCTQVARFLAKGCDSRGVRWDLFQDTMVDVWAKLPEKRPATEAELLRLLRNMAWTSKNLRAPSREARGFHREAMLQLIPDPTPTRSPTSKIVQREIAERYLLELSTPIREAVLWRVGGRTLAQFAEEKRISVSTAQSRHRIGMDQLRKRLARDNLTPSQCGL